MCNVILAYTVLACVMLKSVTRSEQVNYELVMMQCDWIIIFEGLVPASYSPVLHWSRSRRPGCGVVLPHKGSPYVSLTYIRITVLESASHVGVVYSTPESR
jgi:hypothetical protein